MGRRFTVILAVSAVAILLVLIVMLVVIKNSDEVFVPDVISSTFVHTNEYIGTEIAGTATANAYTVTPTPTPPHRDSF